MQLTALAASTGAKRSRLLPIVCVRLAPRCDLLTYFPRQLSSDALRVGIRIPDSLTDGFRGFLRNAGPGPGRRCEPPSRFLLRDVWLCSSVRRCVLMPLPDSFFCNPVPVRLSFHRDLTQAGL